MASGGGAAQLNETFATMGISGLSSRSFICIEIGIGKWWEFSG